MLKRTLVVVLLALVGRVPAHAQNGAPALQDIAAALGAAHVQTIEFSGYGSDFIFGQAYDPHTPWPRFHLPAYTVTIDYAAPAIRDDRRRAQAENPPLGGGFQPLIGELRQIWLMSQGYAWDLAGDTVVAPAVERDLRSAVDGRLAQIWLTPHGFIKAALAGKTATRVEEIRGARKTVVSVTTPTGVRLEGVINAANEIEHIETPLSHPMLGDIVYEAHFSGYKDFAGVKFPTRIVHHNGGYPVLDVTIASVKTNQPFSLPVPESIRAAKTPPAAPIVPEKLADGVWMMPGYAKSVLVEFRDHLVVIDAPEGEARSLAVMEAARAVAPGKPIRYVINTHSHFDHASGLRTYAAEGVTIVTHPDNIPYYEQVWSLPRTIAPDRLSRAGRTASFEGIVGARTFTDGARRMVVYHYAGNMHNPGMLMVHFPKERILVEADSFTPAATPADAPAGIANLAHFTTWVDRLRLEVEQVVPIHGRLSTMDEARNAVMTFGRPQLWAR